MSDTPATVRPPLPRRRVPAPTDQAVWERMGQLMPVHDCGRRMQPGGSDGLGPVLVCVPCASVASVDPEWAEKMAEQARAQLTREAARVTHAMGDDLSAMCGPTVPDGTGRIVLTVTPSEVTCPKCLRTCGRCGWQTIADRCPQCGADPDAAAI